MKIKSTTSRELLTAAIATAALVGAGAALAVPDQPEEWEKCAGISKAG